MAVRPGRLGRLPGLAFVSALVLSGTAICPAMGGSAAAPPSSLVPPGAEVGACVANPDLTCLSDVVFAIRAEAKNDIRGSVVAKRLARAGRLDLAGRMAESISDPRHRAEVLRVIAQREIAEEAAANPGRVVALEALDAFVRGEGPMAAAPSSMSPFAEIAEDILGQGPYGPPYLFLPETRPWSATDRPGAATVRAMLPRWRAYAAGLPAASRPGEWWRMAKTMALLGDRDGAADVLAEAEEVAAGTRMADAALNLVSVGWLRLGRTDKALDAVLRAPEPSSFQLASIIARMQDEGAPPDRVMPLVHRALSSVYQKGERVDFELVRRLVRAAGRAGHLDEAQAMLQDGADLARAKAELKWRALMFPAAASLDIGNRAMAQSLLAESTRLARSFTPRDAALQEIAAQVFRLGDVQAFEGMRATLAAGQRWSVWFRVLAENSVPEDPVAFAAKISAGLQAPQRFMLYVATARRLAEDRRDSDASHVLLRGLAIAEAAEGDAKYGTYSDAGIAALRAGDRQLAARAVRIGIRVAAADRDRIMYLSDALAFWREQLSGEALAN